MAPKKKPTKPNGYVIFVQDLQRQQGRKYATSKEAFDAAAPLWARLSAEQKKSYDDRAKEMKGNNTRYTSEGIDVDFLTQEEHRKNQAEEKMRQEIRNNLAMAQRRKVLDNEVFFVVHCNIFCHYSNEDRYWPAEIAVLCFTLKDGVKLENIFHFLVEPGRLPLGYKFDAKQHSDETHQIKVPSDDDDTNNQEEIYFNLKAFLEKKKPEGVKHMPVLYADKKSMKVVQNILNTWAEHYDGERDMFKVYNLQVMFYHLRNNVAGDQVWSSFTFSDREIEKDVYAYVPDIACSFHASTSKPLYCSRSIVLRYAFVICDNCCGDLNIDLIEGQHVPIYSTIPDSSSTYGSSSSRSSRSGRSSRRGFDNDFETDSNTDSWDTESLASNTSMSTITSNIDDFPALGKSRSASQASTYSDLTPNNSSSARSYAGATGKALPHAFEKSMSELSINSGSRPPSSFGRGFRKKITDSDSDLSIGSVPAGDATNSNFPALPVGRGRGFRPKTERKPGPQN